MGDFFKKLKEGVNKDGNQKKKIENLVFFLILLIIVVVAINIIWSPSEDDNGSGNSGLDGEKQFVSHNSNTSALAANSTGKNVENQQYTLESDLENILANIEGAGNVQVMITYTESSEIKVLYNESVEESTTEETDSTGGVRTIAETNNSKEIAYTEADGKKTPITEKVILPKIEGAIILAQGANNAAVKNNIILAVEAVTGLSSHKIQVFQLK